MKCANDSICEFDGIGTYEGSINGYCIILENVYYSKNVNKRLLNDINNKNNYIKY